MTTPASSQLVSPLTTGALVFETPTRTTLPSPPVSSPLLAFTTPRVEGWDRRTTTFERSRSRSRQHLPPTPFLLLPRLLQLPARRLSHLLHLQVPRHQLGLFSARTTTTTPLASQCDLRGLSLLHRWILPLRLRLSLLFDACCQRGRLIGGVRGECRFLSSL
jgi:hypothetical protein